MRSVVDAVAAAFRRPPPEVGITPAAVVHRENKWRLLRYLSQTPPRRATPVLLVPSLINRHYILDLRPGRSLAEFLLQRGHDVYAIDWGRPGDEDRFLEFDDYADRYLGRASRVAARTSGSPGGVHMVGYCLGGTLAAIHAAARPENVATLTAIAAPICFDDSGLLSRWTRTGTFDVGALVDALGNVPWQLMQSAFHLLRPTLSAAKAVSLLEKRFDDEFLDGFFSLEAWGNDNVSFPGECYRRYVEELYRKDALLAGTFTLSGRPARLESIECPVLAVTFEHDNIVPKESAAMLLDRVGSQDKRRIHRTGGHVGAMVSKKAVTELWPAMSDWWAERDGRSEPASVARSEARRRAS
jgi:polyhydroxyalkanoate synthase